MAQESLVPVRGNEANEGVEPGRNWINGVSVIGQS